MRLKSKGGFYEGGGLDDARAAAELAEKAGNTVSVISIATGLLSAVMVGKTDSKGWRNVLAGSAGFMGIGIGLRSFGIGLNTVLDDLYVVDDDIAE